MNKINVLDHGYVQHIESWGMGIDGNHKNSEGTRTYDDYECGIIEAARQSTQGSFRGWEQDQKLLKYMYNHKHSTPFEFSGMVIEVQAPIFVFREWHRHRTQCLDRDSIIHFNRKRLTRRTDVLKKSIGSIWDRFQPKLGKGNNPSSGFSIKDMSLRCLNEDTRELSDTRILNVIKGDPKEMVWIRTKSGTKSITATREHRFYTIEGWMTLGEAINNKVMLAIEGTKRGKLQQWIPEIDISKEEWKPVVGFEEDYEVSNQGRVRNKHTLNILTPNSYDYLRVYLGESSNRIAKYVHLLVLDAFVGPKTKGMEARHKNHNRLDARLENLCYGTHEENTRDSKESDRFIRLGIDYEYIDAVVDVGLKDTYDLSVCGPYHNFVADGFVVHNSYNEMSARYGPLPNNNYLPTEERCFLVQSNNKQAQGLNGTQLTHEDALIWLERLTNFYEHAQDLYQDGLDIGILKEVARICVPVGRYSRMRASANLRNWLAFLTLRMSPDAQWEIRMFAQAVAEICRKEFPHIMELFDNA